jgi:hypothetical protein
MVRLSEQERAAVDAAAQAAGLAAGAWLGELAARAISSTAKNGWNWWLSRADVVGVLLRVRADVSRAAVFAGLGADGAARLGEVLRAALVRLDTLIDRAVAGCTAEAATSTAADEAGDATADTPPDDTGGAAAETTAETGAEPATGGGPATRDDDPPNGVES